MPAAPLPPDERERQQILNRYAILDTLPEQQYDDLTFLASQICDTPISLLSLIDRDRQWFKSHHGLEVCETPREMSFCAHAILQSSLLEVPDTALDPRFADNYLVENAPLIRFYAGAPLITPEGFCLGTLCVIDHKPRQLSANQLRSLEALARQAVGQMELWRSCRQFEIADAERGIALGVAQETTARLAESESRFRYFMDNSPVLAFMKDDVGRYVYLNAPFEKTFNITSEQLKGKTDFAHLPAGVAEAVRANDKLVFHTNQTSQLIEVVPTPDGRQHEWLVFKFPIREASGALFLGGVALDVTEQRRAERLKSEFVSVISHELRTPLTSIRGALGLLAGGVAGEMSQGARQMIDIAQKNSDRLILLINDILDIEKIESGQMRFDARPLALQSWLEASVEQNRSYGATLDVQIALEKGEELGKIEVLADVHRLDQVLSNLLSNACKWTPAGGVVYVETEIIGQKAVISVRDEGPGVPLDFVPRLFEKFGQADSSSTRQKGGTGLGLSITRAIVEKMGGHLEYIAPQNGATGATFRFDLPLSSVRNPSVPIAATSAPQILICEDDEEVAALLQTLAQQNGYEAAIAATLEEARTLLANGGFVGLTLDLMLPDGDGLDLLREVRASGNELPVIVISAFSEAGQLRGAALHVLDWLDKPLLPERLLTALGQFSGARGASVLHVEDDSDVRQIVAAILGEETRVAAAATLLEARQRLQTQHFDLAILDLGLRDGNGLELLEELGATDPPTPVILFSAQEPDREHTGMVAASLVKSRTANEELRATIRRFLVKKPA